MVSSLVADTPHTHPTDGFGGTHMTNFPRSDTSSNHNLNKDTPTNQMVGVKRPLPLAQGQNKKRITTFLLDPTTEEKKARDLLAPKRALTGRGGGAVATTVTPAPRTGTGVNDTHMTCVHTRPPSPYSDDETHPPHDPGDLEKGVASSLARLWEMEKDGIATDSPVKKDGAPVTLPSPPHNHEALGKRVAGLSVSPNLQRGHVTSPPHPHPHPKDKNTRGLSNLAEIFCTPNKTFSKLPYTNPCNKCGTPVTFQDPCTECDLILSQGEPHETQTQTHTRTQVQTSILSLFNPPKTGSRGH
jgi:hypothetical protein